MGLDETAVDVEERVTEVIELHGRVDVLVNNARFGMARALEGTR